MGFPTANILIGEAYKLIPRLGVYLVKSKIDEKIVYGMMNIGKNPTVSVAEQTNIEVHFFDFKSDIYDCTLKIEFLDFLRREIKFPTIEALKNQLIKDKLEATKRIDLMFKI